MLDLSDLFIITANILTLFQAAKERIASEFVGKVNKKELDEGFGNIKSTYVSNTEEIFYKFGKYLKKNILAIPSNIVLPEDHPHIEPEGRNYNSHQLQEDLAQTKKLHQEILNAMYQKAVLKKPNWQIYKLLPIGNKIW